MTSDLTESASPYLRAHAGQPVAWFAWGEDAFAEARRRDIPVMVSIGYATCHWCHVMSAESFSDPSTGALLNDTLIAIKVDREEHPEVDAVFLSAAAAFTPHLGWPLTVFTTPEGQPFFAGTHWPREARGGLPAFADVVRAVGEAWAERREAVLDTSRSLQGALRAAAAEAAAATGELSASALAPLAHRILAREDTVHGGFAAADADARTPKFPTVPVLRFLQSAALADALPEAAAFAARTIEVMASSPLRDEDGGFFRYATRRDWSEPHYERMLTDNAGLLLASLDAGRADVAEGIARFLLDALLLDGGGFAAAQDSESVIDGARSEGGYYRRPLAGRSALAAPSVDAKLVTAWNGLAIEALATAGARLGRSDLIAAAARAADAVAEANLAPDGTLRRASLDEITSSAPAVLEDYGGYAGGLLALAAATGELAYAVEARRLVDLCLDGTGAVRVPGGRDPVLARLGAPEVDDADTDRPSGEAAFAAAAATLWELGADERYRETARRLVAARAPRAIGEPFAHGAILRVAARLSRPPRQIVVVAASTDDPLVLAAHERGADTIVRVAATDAEAWAAAGFSLFEGRTSPDGRSTAYVCEGFVCLLPTHDAATLSISPR